MSCRNKKGGKGRVRYSSSIDETYNKKTPLPIKSANEFPLSKCYEEKFLQAVENVREKSPQTRVAAMESICESLKHRYMPDYVSEHKETLVDCIRKSLSRGKDSEQVWAARLASLLVLQLGGNDKFSKCLNKFLLTTVQDKSVSFNVRSTCCTALGLLNLLGNANIDVVLRLMEFLEDIFCESYLKDDSDKKSVSINADAATLHAEALSVWSILATKIPSKDFVLMMTTGRSMLPPFKKLMGLLKSSHLEMRIAAGETLALILEIGRAFNENFLEEYLGDLIEVVQQLATDSQKFRGKRDRKSQRATFRDILHYLEDNILPETNIRFGTECLILDSWALHHQYSVFCVVVGPGMTLQLQENDFIREIFKLKAKVTQTIIAPKIKASKSHTGKIMDTTTFKTRIISRTKNLQYMPKCVDSPNDILIDCLEKNIRGGKGSEQVWGSSLVPLIMLQLRGDEQVFKVLEQFFFTNMLHYDIRLDVRANCCSALGLVSYFGNADSKNLLTLMHYFDYLFRESYMKGGNQTVNADAATLHSQALLAWGLLISKLPPEDINLSWNRREYYRLTSFIKLMAILKSAHLEVRLAAGETLALIFECGRAYDKNFLDEYLGDLIDIIKKLAVDSNEHRDQRDRKAHRVTFKDILCYLEENIPPKISIRFGSECLVLDSWATYHHYLSWCFLMGPGMMLQLEKNNFIREIFGLPPNLAQNDEAPKNKMFMFEKHLIKVDDFKDYTVVRAKNPDICSEAFN